MASYYFKTPSRVIQPMDLQTMEGETQVDISVPRVREMGAPSVNAYVEAKYFQYPVCSETPWDDLRCVLDDSDEWIELQKNDQILSFFCFFRLIARHFHIEFNALLNRSLPHFQIHPPTHPNPLSSQRNGSIAHPHRPILPRRLGCLSRRPRRHHPPFPVGIHSLWGALRRDLDVPRFFVRFRESRPRFAVSFRQFPAVLPSIPPNGRSGCKVETWNRGCRRRRCSRSLRCRAR